MTRLVMRTRLAYGVTMIGLVGVFGCGSTSFNTDEGIDSGGSDTNSGTDSTSGDGSGTDGSSETTPPTDGTSTDTTPADTTPPCEAPKKICGGVCVDIATDPANCGDCAKPCAAPMVCGGGTCAPPKCKTTAPNVLFYGPCGSMEKAFLPTGATSTTADDATWRKMTTADFQKFDLIVIGAPDLSVSSSSTPTAAMLLAAFDTRAVWGAAVNGRISVLGLDPAYHADKAVAGAITYQKAVLSWLTTGAPSTTSLYVNSDWGVRKLDFMSPFGTLSSSAATSNTITITLGTHPTMVGSTSASLSAWGTSAHSFVTFPTTFTATATGTSSGSGTTTTGTVAAVKDGPACTP